MGAPHDKLDIRGVSHDESALAMNRIKAIRVGPPTGNDWMECMLEKYPELPKDIIAFFAGIVDEIRSRPHMDFDAGGVENDEKVRTVENDEKVRTLELALRDLSNIYFSYWDETKQFNDLIWSQKEILEKIDDSLISIAPEDKARFMAYLSERSKIAEILSKSDIPRTTKIAALSYIGDMLRQLYDTGGRDLNSFLIPANDIGKYIEKLSDSRELLGFLLLGAGIYDKNTTIDTALKRVVFILEILNGKNVQSAYRSVAQMNIDMVRMLYDINYYKTVEQKLENLAQTDIGRALLDMFWHYVNNRISKVVQLISDYYLITKTDEEKKNSTKTDEEKKNSMEKKILKHIDKDTFEKICSYLNEVYERNYEKFLEEEKRRLKSQSDFSFKAPDASKENKQDNPKTP